MSLRQGALRAACVTTLAVASLLLISACQTPPPAPVVREVVEALSLDQAVAAATDSLAAQVKPPETLLSRLEKPVKRPVLMDPSLDAASGQQTALTRQLDQKVNDRLRVHAAQFDVLPFAQASLGRAQYLLVGTITRMDNARGVFQIHLAMAEMKTGKVVAQASARAKDENFDTTPTPYYRDTPVLMLKDRVVEGYMRTAQTAPGQPADSAYLERVAATAMIQEATTLYNAERYQDALGLYRESLATPAGEQMRSLNGVYLSNWKLGNVGEAEAAFGKVVALGLASKALGVKFLFNPGSTDFWADANISGPYQLWLRQIARQAAQTKVCMDIVGHTSHTGSEAFNDRLSAQRAASIQRKLEAEAPALVGRLKSSGVGFRENLIGTGTDDASDSLDRRVEFKINAC
ncbi:OmpA family protein [Aquabacterium sp.]|uniref:OmpA family protein n=1 Tax=Aquabacterium sp. TaxID=1872578 RepID=UPI003783AB3F